MTPRITAAHAALVFALLLVSPYHIIAQSMTGLAISGNRIVNGNGQYVKLVGVNRSGIEFSCVQGNGFSDGPVDQTSITAMKTWNINTVRVPLNEDCWLDINGANPGGSTYTSQVVTFVELLTSNGFAVVLDLHWTASGTTLATAQTPMPDADHAPAFWTSVATTFGSYTNVIFDLFNEPYPCFSGSGMSCSSTSCNAGDTTTPAAWECWLNGGSSCPGLSYTAVGMQTLVTTVRATGAKNLLLLNGIHYSGCINQWETYKPTDTLSNRIIAGVHLYGGNTCYEESCWTSTIQPVATSYPILFGEIGEYDCATSFIVPLITWADSLNINYIGWTWNTWDCASGPALISDYTGTATAFGSGYQSHIASLTLFSASGSAATTTATTASTSHATTATTVTTSHATTATTAAATTSHATTATTAAATTGTATKPSTTTTTTGAASSSTSCKVSVAQSQTGSWTGGGQVAVTITNSGTSALKSVTVNVPSTTTISSIWGVNTPSPYTVSSYALPIAVGGSFTGVGYVYAGSALPTITVSATC